MTNEELFDTNCEDYFGDREPLRLEGLDGDDSLDEYVDQEFGRTKKPTGRKSVVLQVDDVHHKVNSAFKR